MVIYHKGFVVQSTLKETPSVDKKDWVRETRFGDWFLSTDIWVRYVLSEALGEFKRLSGDVVVNHILDAGCGRALSFPILVDNFQPANITGIDINGALLEKAKRDHDDDACRFNYQRQSVVNLSFADNSFDMVLCHQLIHHVSQQVDALQELYRVLSPGGLLLLSESCASFVNSLPVRLLFRHPKNVQKTAEEYVELVKSVGFHVSESKVKKYRPWWSLMMFGLLDKLGIPTRGNQPTEVLLVAYKP